MSLNNSQIVIHVILLICPWTPINGCELEESPKHATLVSIPPQTNPQINKKVIDEADLRVLFIGNSHAAPVPHWLREIFAVEQPGKKVLCAAAPGFGFLADHANRQSTISLIKMSTWDFVVLQAQKYSTSGKYAYPHDGAIKLCGIAKAMGSNVLMYPEWSRRGFPDEYVRITKIHREIAQQAGAQVAPIGATWARVARENSHIALYAADGNHASELGSYLNACVFYGIITGRPVVKGYSPRGKQADWEKYEPQIAVLHETAWSAVQELKTDAAEMGGSVARPREK